MKITFCEKGNYPHVPLGLKCSFMPRRYKPLVQGGEFLCLFPGVGCRLVAEHAAGADGLHGVAVLEVHPLDQLFLKRLDAAGRDRVHQALCGDEEGDDLLLDGFRLVLALFEHLDEALAPA